MTEPFDLDWADCEPDWNDDEDDIRLPPDLRGQRLTTTQFLTLTDIQPAGSYL
jgi:hypothetical protein